MKKTLILILTALISISLAYASDVYDDWKNDDYAYNEIGGRPESLSVRMKGMGGAGLALTQSANGLFVNPASLADGELSLSFPSVSVTFHHFHDAIKRRAGEKSLFELLFDRKRNNAEFFSSLLSVIGTERSPLLEADCHTSFVTPYGLGLAINASDTVFSYSGSLINETGYSFSLGYGHSFSYGDFSLKLGTTTALRYLVFSQRIKAAFFVEGNNVWNEKFSFAYGWAFPVTDIGMKASWKGLTFALVLDNLFSSWHMGMQDSTIRDSLCGKSSSVDYSLFVIEKKASLSCGLAYENNWGDFEYAAAVDFNDILTFWTSDEMYSELGRRILRRLKLGFEAGWRDIASLRFGLNGGYFTLGLSLRYSGLLIEAAYYWEEKGSDAGDIGLDGLSVRIRAGL